VTFRSGSCSELSRTARAKAERSCIGLDQLSRLTSIGWRPYRETNTMEDIHGTFAFCSGSSSGLGDMVGATGNDDSGLLFAPSFPGIR